MNELKRAQETVEKKAPASPNRRLFVSITRPSGLISKGEINKNHALSNNMTRGRVRMRKKTENVKRERGVKTPLKREKERRKRKRKEKVGGPKLMKRKK